VRLGMRMFIPQYLVMKGMRYDVLMLINFID